MPFNNRPITPLVFGLASTLTALVAAACGGKTDSANAERHSEFQSSSLPDEDAGGPSNTPTTVAAPSATSSTPPAACPTAEVSDVPIPDELSNRYVTFRVTNTGTKVVYMAAQGLGCTEYSIDDGNGCPVPLLTWPSSPPCRADANWGYADTFSRLDPGQTYEIRWDTTKVAAYMASGCAIGASRTVEPGVYRVTFGFELAPPAGCNADSNPYLWYCASRQGISGGPVYASRCSTSGGTATAEFVLSHLPDSTRLTTPAIRSLCRSR